MNKQLKKDNTLFKVIFCLCGAILLLGISSFITDYQYKGIRQQIKDISLENKQLMSENQTLESKLETSKAIADVEGILKETAIEDIATLRSYYNEVVWPYMDNFEEITYEYDSLVVDIYNDMSWIMTDYQERTFENRLKELQKDWEDLDNELEAEVDDWIENNSMFY